MTRFRGRITLFSLLAAVLVPAIAAHPAQAASGTTLSPAPGASVTVTPKAGFANGDLILQWSAEFAGCPGPDSIHGSYPETRPEGAGDTDWQGHQRGGPFFGPGTFSTTMTLFPMDYPQRYEWRVRVACGATTDFAGANIFSPVIGFTLLPRSLPLAVQSLSTAPKQPRAGALVTVRLGVIAKETGAPVTRGAITCSAAIAGKSVIRLARGFSGGVAFCRWRIPKSASAKQLRGTISVLLNGERVVRSFTRRMAR